ncbi:MAG: cache domain-containing protein, partial [Gemmatimonadota bacterium]|nr:cache domain-containing protein [Gemmatimonadota bacterium]
MSPWEGRMARLFSALRLESIKNKIVTLAVAATLIPTVTTAVVSYAQNTRSLADQLQRELQRAVNQTALELDLWLQQQLVELAGLETSYVVSENLARLGDDGPGRYQALSRLEEYVAAVGPRLPDFGEVLILDAEGLPVASSRPGSTTGPPQAWARSVVGGIEGFGEPFVDPESGTLEAYAGRPVRSPSRSQVLGAVVARVQFQDVRRLLAEHLPTHGGRVMLVLGDGRVAG